MICSVDKATLSSILFHVWQKRIKVNYYKYQSQKNKYFEEYIEAVEKGDNPGIIVRIAQKYRIPPCLVAKFILQKYFQQNDEDASGGNKVTTYLRDTTLIPNMDLAYETFMVGVYFQCNR